MINADFTNKKGPAFRLTLKYTGADNGARTRDPNLGKVVLYQLSHVRFARNYYT